MLKTKPGFLLRRLGDEAMVVAIGEAAQDFNGMIRMNETAALYWNALEKGTTAEQLVQLTLGQFDGVDRETARRDVNEFLDAVAAAIQDVPQQD